MAEATRIEVVVAEDGAELAELAAGRIAGALRAAVAARGRATLALSGSSTPVPTYERLATLEVPWEATTLVWVDERFVPYESPRSNYGEAARSWLPRLPRTPAAVHPIPAPLPGAFDADAVDWAAAAYEETLRRAAPGDPVPVLDVMVLGVGVDGHTASLFPAHAALEERERAVAPVPPAHGHEPREPRITLTFPVLFAARERVVIVAGASKREVVDAALAGPIEGIPAARLREAAGPTVWFVDRAAAPAG